MDLLESMERGTSWKDVLYEVVSQQDFNPWDIDVGTLASAYLEKIRQIKIVNFTVPGTVVLVGAVLIKLKSDVVVNNTNFLEAYFGDSSADADLGDMPDFSDAVDSNEIVREIRAEQKLLVRRLPKRGVSLPELVEFLNRVVGEAERRNVWARLDSKDNRMAMKVRKLDLEKIMKNVYDQIKTHTNNNGGKVPVRNLMEKQTREQLVWYLFPLLHLAHKNKVDLYQKKMYDELYVSIAD